MLVGICGQAGSGKDTVADYLCRNHSFVKVAFADPLKRICREVFDFSDEQLWGPSEKRNEPDERYVRGWTVPGGGAVLPFEWAVPTNPGEKPKAVYLTSRYALQTLGTEWGRNCYPNVWVAYAIRVHKCLQEGGWAYDQKRGLYTVSVLMDRRKNPDAMMWPKIHVVVSDVRFRNEVEELKKAGGLVLKVVRPGYEGDVGISGHASEEEQKSIHDKEFSAIIVNSSTLDWLYTTVDSVMKSFVAIGT